MGKIQAKSIFRLVPLIGDLGRFLWAFTLKEPLLVDDFSGFALFILAMKL